MQPRLPFDAAPRTPHDAAPRPPNPEPPFVFARHPRARRYVIRVADDGTIRVTIPRWGSKREATAFVERERRWI